MHGLSVLLTPRQDTTGRFGRGGDILLFVPWVSALDAVGAVGHRDRVDGRALLAGGMGRVRRVRQASARLASVVVKLHQAEDEVGGHQLEPVWGVGDDIPAWEGGAVTEGDATGTCRGMADYQWLNHSPLRALALSVEVRVSETVDAEAKHVVGLQGFTKEVAIATAILPETKRGSFI